LKSPYVLQAIVYEREGVLIARAYLDQDLLDREFGHVDTSEPASQELASRLLESIRVETNEHLPAFSAIQKMVRQPEPFELTPTNKVKRYLYTG
jgi:long-chain acyl-CoA synthetase